MMRALPLAAAMLLASTAASAEQAPPKPDWSGAWIDAALDVDVSGIPVTGSSYDVDAASKQYPLFGIKAPWNAEGQARFGKVLGKIVAGLDKTDGWGFPMMMDAPAPFEIVIAPDRVLIYNIYREVRVIYTDGRPHASDEDRWPTTWGDSIGHWEGDTLVIDTLSVRDPTAFADFAPPLSDQAHYVERLRPGAPGEIQSDITIEDPTTLAGPWSMHFTYRRLDQPDRVVLDAISNDRTGIDQGVFTIEPPKDEH